MTKMIDFFKAARRAGTPLIAIKTTDPERTMLSIQDFNPKTPVISWDCVNGWQSRNGKPGQDAIDVALEKSEHPIEATVNYSTHLEMALHLPADPEASQPTNPILFVLNGHKYFDEKEFVQALWNLREPFKESFRSVVLLGPAFDLPAELLHDILVLDEPLPNDVELREMVVRITKGNNVQLTDAVIEDAVDALRGLGAFEAEQAVSMCLTRTGLNIQDLWERKRQMINQTPGLSVWRGGQKFEDIGGLDEVKNRFHRIIKGKACPKLIVWIDEIEKAMAGASGDGRGDSSGTSDDQLGVILSTMQDEDYSGAMFIGVPGAAKSALAKAIANQIGVLTLKLDLGALKGGIVGESEAKVRNAMKIIEAVAGPGGAFFIATSNDIRVIKPELKRRFKKGIWFFPLPTQAERAVIWDIYLKKYNFTERYSDANITFDDKWTGAEIESCVQTAWEEDVDFETAARSIIPVAISGKEQVDRLYAESHNRYNSVSYPGVFDKNREMATETPKAGSRKIAQIEEEEVLQA